MAAEYLSPHPVQRLVQREPHAFNHFLLNRAANPLVLVVLFYKINILYARLCFRTFQKRRETGSGNYERLLWEVWPHAFPAPSAPTPERTRPSPSAQAGQSAHLPASSRTDSQTAPSCSRGCPPPQRARTKECPMRRLFCPPSPAAAMCPCSQSDLCRRCSFPPHTKVFPARCHAACGNI